MSERASPHNGPLLLKHMTPGAVRDVLAADPRLLVPVGTTEQHGPHLPLGCDTILLERLADDLSAAFRVLRAPTIEYGVNAVTKVTYPGNATVRRKTLHRFMNDLIGSWEASGVRQFIILTAHSHDPHQEALTTLFTTRGSVRTVNVLDVPWGADAPIDEAFVHGGEIDTSLLLYLRAELVRADQAQDYAPTRPSLRRFGVMAIPAEGPGSLGRPTLASVEKGARLYHLIYDRIASRIMTLPGEAAP